MRASSVIFAQERTNYPLSVSVDDTGAGFSFDVEAVAPADAGQVCALLVTATASLVTALEQAPDMPLHRVEVLGAAEREQVLSGWNDTARAVPAAGGVQSWSGCGRRWRRMRWRWRAVMSRGPTGGCASGPGGWRGCWRQAGAGPESVVGLCLERGPEMVAAIVGVWRAGAAYLPLDPGYPAERLAFMLADSRAGLVMAAAAMPAAGLAGRAVAGGLADRPAGRDGGAGGRRPPAPPAVRVRPRAGVRDLHVGVVGGAQGGAGPGTAGW